MVPFLSKMVYKNVVGPRCDQIDLLRSYLNLLHHLRFKIVSCKEINFSLVPSAGLKAKDPRSNFCQPEIEEIGIFKQRKHNGK